LGVCDLGLVDLGVGKEAEVVAARVGDDAARAGDDLVDAAASCALGGRKSFAADTPVLMADGTTKPIDHIRVGDQVLATDPYTGEQAAKTVTHVWVHTDTLTDLALTDGTTLTTTEDHPFWSATDHRFERADELAPGEKLLRADGHQATVTGLKPATSHQAPAYNLTVADIHTYYVLAGDEPVLVHNGGVPGTGEIYLWRAVTGPELADITANRTWNSPQGIKYFSFTEQGAAEYARRAYAAYPGEGPYTMIRTTANLADLPESARMAYTADVIDGGVALNNDELRIAKRPSIMTSMSTVIGCK